VPLIGWDILALSYGGWVWFTVWRLDAESAQDDAKREDASRDLAGLVLLGAAVASLIAVGVVLNKPPYVARNPPSAANVWPVM
jgi:uncharacterized membrane protein